MALTRSRIEYIDRGWAFQTGCNHWKTGVCPVGTRCWAYRKAHHFHESFEPILHPEKLLEPLSLRKPARIGVNFTGDGFGEWVDPMKQTTAHWKHYGERSSPDMTLRDVVKSVLVMSDSRFLFLTKNPAGYAKWGEWPDNAWLGASVCDAESESRAYLGLKSAGAKHKWLSYEPVMGPCAMPPQFLRDAGIKWVVIGSWSGNRGPEVKIEWVEEIESACQDAGIPYWEKLNLQKLLKRPLIQELPAALQLSEVKR